MSNRRVDTEAARKERLQPVHCWEKRLITPPNTSIKVWRWFKTDRKQEFSDDEEDEASKAAVVVDDEEEVVPVSANPDGEAQETETGEDGVTRAKPAKKAVKLADDIANTDDAKNKGDDDGEGEGDDEDDKDDAIVPPPMPERSRSPSVPPETSTTDFLNVPLVPTNDGLTPDHATGDGLFFGDAGDSLGAEGGDDVADVLDALMTDAHGFDEAAAAVAAASFDGDGLDDAILGADVDDLMNGTG